MDLREEESPADSPWSQQVPVFSRYPPDHTLESELSEIVRHLAAPIGGSIRIEQSSRVIAELLVREAIRGVCERAQGCQERQDPWFAKPQGGDTLAVHLRRQHDLAETIRSERAVVADSLDAQ